MTIYPSTTSFLIAIGPYVTDRGKYILWQDQGAALFGLQAKANLQDILAIPLVKILQGLGIELFYSNTVQRARVDTWLRVVEASVTAPNGEFYYGILFTQASSNLALEGSGSLAMTLSRSRGLVLSLEGDSDVGMDATVS